MPPSLAGSAEGDRERPGRAPGRLLISPPEASKPRQGHTMNVVEATRAYEAWMRVHIAIVAADIKLKHELMAAAPFPFLRATFYRWAQIWHEVCPDLAATPVLLAIGDLHVENFGTWRDAEGRLVWGINDFDEAASMPYAIDLVRLSTS